MKAIKVNADYESVLFHQKEGPRIINESLEFLSLFIENRPLFSFKKYDQEYLDYIRSITGNRPVIVNEGEFENWWGALSNIPLEQKLNSKEFTAGLNQDSKIISSLSELVLENDKSYLAKNPFGMSGQNFQVFQSSVKESIKPLLQKTGRLLVEPFLKREADFSHYVFSPELEICYENLVDQSFQYKGTLFNDRFHPGIESLRFYKKLDSDKWDEFQQSYSRLKDLCLSAGVYGGYSVDSFTYRENQELCIRAVSEINFRKTMGMVAWKLSEKFTAKNPWTLFLAVKPSKNPLSFQDLKMQIESISWSPEDKRGALLLSPGDTRFHFFLLSAGSGQEGRVLFRELKNLLPDCQFSVEL